MTFYLSGILGWFDQHAGAIQALSAIVVAILTGLLVCLTRRYVKETDQALNLARDQLRTMREQSAEQKRGLDLAFEQFEREWRPNLRIADVERWEGTIRLRLVNLAHPAAFVKELRIGTGGNRETPPQGIEAYPMVDVVPGGEIYDDARISTFLSNYRGKYRRPPEPLARSQWQSIFSLAVVYDCATQSNIRTDWFNCSVTFEDYAVTKLERIVAPRDGQT